MLMTATLALLWLTLPSLHITSAAADSPSPSNLTSQGSTPPLTIPNINSTTNLTDSQTACYSSWGGRQPISYEACTPLLKSWTKFHRNVKHWILNPTTTSIPVFRSTGYLRTPWIYVKGDCQMTISRLGPDMAPETMQKSDAVEALTEVLNQCTGGSPEQAPQGPWDFGGMVWFQDRKIKMLLEKTKPGSGDTDPNGQAVVADGTGDDGGSGDEPNVFA